jgi:hypothetical protein
MCDDKGHGFPHVFIEFDNPNPTTLSSFANPWPIYRNDAINNE